ncbi:MAG TPA: quinolinate synthase [Nitrospirae bacterium]|nr:quinolinate synthase A [bacterium BMS3Abin06]HDH13080.1 quinolinate synthase [Nitrospirota bacterium]HDZ02900.1 quinolinate synthase [Nitrospirota bacterium]
MTDIAILREKILNLKEKKNAIILAHNYQRDEVQDIADHTGDSLELSRIAASIECEVIVFCGVNFMAESASILSPEKTVLLPEIKACCPMADMVTVSGARNLKNYFPGYEYTGGYRYPADFTLRDIKKLHPGVPVVTYVNTTADVKAESDICCTSANSVKIVESLNTGKVICIPDRNLSAWIAKNTETEVISWDGFCHVHDRVTAADVEKARQEHPGALLLAHPECRMEVLEKADHVTSTSGMLRYAASSDAGEFIIGTETGLMYRLGKDNPGKKFYPLRKDMVCPNMKKTSLGSVLHALESETYKIKVPEEIRIPAKKALDRMLEVK